MKTMMYVCPVDWRWIKQRPHFLAEEFLRFYDLHAIYPFKNNRHGLQKKQPTPVPLTPYFNLPTLSRRLPLIGRLNVPLSAFQMRRMMHRIQPDILWLSMPFQEDYFPEDLPCTVVYDCMDNHAAYAWDEKHAAELIEQEARLVRRADVIFASSENLRSTMHERYGVPWEKMILLRNGYNSDWSDPAPRAPQAKPLSSLQIGFIGTVGRWFDFDRLLSSLRRFPNLTYHLFGPLEDGTHIPEHERLIYRGVIEHAQLPQYGAQMDALIMPFVINDVVRNIDPIKLYEYIRMDKPILCVRYPEVERFDPFVSFYSSDEELAQQIMRLSECPVPKYTQEQAAQFLQENHWRRRAEAAFAVMEGLAPRSARTK